MIQLYDYQASDQAKALESLKTHQRVLFQASTGYGKTIVMTDLVAKLIKNYNYNILILVHRSELLEQTRNALIKFGISSEPITDKTKFLLRNTNVYVGMVETVHNRLSKDSNFLTDIDLIITDEAHIQVFHKVTDFFPKAKELAFTATPLINKRERFNLCTFCNAESESKICTNCNNETHEYSRPVTMSQFYDTIVVGYPIHKLIERETLVPELPMAFSASGLENLKVGSDGDYTTKSLNEVYEQEGNLLSVMQNYKTYCTGKKTIIFNSSSKINLIIYEQFKAEGINVRMFDSVNSKESGDRDELLKWFENTPDAALLNVGVFTCVLDDTELLTKSGWKLYSEVNDNDLFAQYDIDSGFINYEKPTRIVKKSFHKGYEMVSLNGRYTDFCVTKTHNMIIKKSPYVKKKHLLPAKDIVNKRWLIPVSGNSIPDEILVEQEKTPERKRFISSNSYNYRKKGMSFKDSVSLAEKNFEIKFSTTYKNPSELTSDECIFIGLMIGDGTWSNGRYQIQLSDKYYRLNKLVVELLKNIGLHYTTHNYGPVNMTTQGVNIKGGSSTRYNFSKGTGGEGQKRDGLYHLIPYLDKNGSELFKGLNKEQIKSLLRGLWLSDGNHGDLTKEPKTYRVCTTSIKLLDILQQICVTNDIRFSYFKTKKRKLSTVNLYRFSFTLDKNWHQMSNQTPDIIKMDRDGFYWCVTMPKSTIVTRRNGKVTIMGNTGFDEPTIEACILNTDTLSYSLYMQMVGRAGRSTNKIFKPNFILIDCGTNIERFGLWSDPTTDWEKIFYNGLGEEKPVRKIPEGFETCDNCWNVFERKHRKCPHCEEEIPEPETTEKTAMEVLALPIREIPPPSPQGILKFVQSKNEKIGFGHKILISQIIDMFIFYRVDYELYKATKSNGKLLKKIKELLHPTYFVLLNANLEGGNRTLNNLQDRVLKRLEKHYEKTN